MLLQCSSSLFYHSAYSCALSTRKKDIVSHLRPPARNKGHCSACQHKFCSICGSSKTMMRKAAEGNDGIPLYLYLIILCFYYLTASCNPAALCSSKCHENLSSKPAFTQASAGRHDMIPVLEVLYSSREEQVIQVMSQLQLLFPIFPTAFSTCSTPISPLFLCKDAGVEGARRPPHSPWAWSCASRPVSQLGTVPTVLRMYLRTGREVRHGLDSKTTQTVKHMFGAC